MGKEEVERMYGVKEDDLTTKQWEILEFVSVFLEERHPLTTTDLARYFSTSPEEMEKIIAVLAKLRWVEKVSEDPIEWDLSRWGVMEQWYIQQDYLMGEEDYEAPKLSWKDLNEEHIALLETFEGLDEKNAKRLPEKIVQSHKSEENPYCVTYALLYDLLKNHFLSQLRPRGFKYFYSTPKTTKTLMRIRGFSLSWEELSTFQKEVLKLLRGSTNESPIPAMRIIELKNKFPFKHPNAKPMFQLKCANLVEHSDYLVEDQTGYYILPKGSELLKRNT